MFQPSCLPVVFLLFHKKNPPGSAQSWTIHESTATLPQTCFFSAWQETIKHHGGDLVEQLRQQKYTKVIMYLMGKKRHDPRVKALNRTMETIPTPLQHHQSTSIPRSHPPNIQGFCSTAQSGCALDKFLDAHSSIPWFQAYIPCNPFPLLLNPPKY